MTVNSKGWSAEIAVLKVRSASTNNFVDLFRLARLDPAKDLRGLDLRRVDLSNCNLCGFDLRGALLDGANLRNTSFSGAIIDVGVQTGLDTRKLTPQERLYLACVAGDIEQLNAAIIDGADPSVADYGRTPLGLCAQNGNFREADRLLDLGVTVNHFDGGITPLSRAASSMHPQATKVAELLINNGAVGKFHALMDCLRAQFSEEMVLLLLRRGALEENAAFEDLTPLMLAAQWLSSQGIREFLEHEAKVDAVNRDGWSAIMFAIEAGNIAAVREFINAGADVLPRGHDEYPFSMAAKKGGEIFQLVADALKRQSA